jgi:hypothetical protein
MGVLQECALAVFNDPAGQAMLIGIPQLLGRVIMDLAPGCDRTLARLTLLVQDENAAGRRPNGLKRELQDPLQQLTQVKLFRQLTADGLEQVERGTGSFRHEPVDLLGRWDLEFKEGLALYDTRVVRV